MKRIAILQSSYIPWKGYFSLIRSVDEVVLLDDVQYTRGDWRNRNRIKSRNGLAWLTIPVFSRNHLRQRIMDTKVADPDWNRRHWKTIYHCYRHADYFNDYKDALEELYLDRQSDYLSEVNFRFLVKTCRLLGITTPMVWSTELDKREDRIMRLLDICKALNATHYCTGPRARNYLDESVFEAEGINVQYWDHSGYSEYEQLHPPFQDKVSILDVILNTGPEAGRYIVN